MRAWTLIVVCGALFSASVVSAPAADTFQAGAATSNITPEIGQEIIGGFVPYPSKHVHDELQARCLVLDDGKTKLAFVVCDLLGLHRIVSTEARRLIQEKAGIPPECVMISATHTHSASSTLGQDRLKHEQTLDEYQQFVAKRIADGVVRALNNCRPAEIAFGTAEAPEHVFNRRWHMRPGTIPENPFGGSDLVKMNPPAGSPNLVEPAGPTDPTVSFIAVREPQGPMISVFAAYSLHYVGGVGSADVSADYYGYFCEHLKRLIEDDAAALRKVGGRKGEALAEPSVAKAAGSAGASPSPATDHPLFVALMANGTSGDINNINFRTPRPAKKPYEQIRFVAEDVAAKVHAAMAKLEYRDNVSLAARYREPIIAWRRPTPEQKTWMEETLAAGPKSKQDLSFIYAERISQLAEYPETTTVPLHVLRIGNVCIATMPCEVFVEIGLDFKRRSPL
ncbi:MAG TPA: hypothetical protein VK137_05545, partial [Planctomycetaceae bacterium]|nr:hypothetical protein [Planctomycetaceae bacterium]